MARKIDVSIILPAKDEAKSIPILIKEISSILIKTKKTYEIIIVDDGSKDNTKEIIKKLKNNKVQLISHRGNLGKSQALQTGFNQARGDTIITMDADLQDDPKEIPNFLRELKSYDVVSGWKKKRYDPISKKIPSKIFNKLVNILTGLNIHDINCGFKAYKRECVMQLNLYGELYRFIPLLLYKENFTIGEIKVNHRPRKYGKSKFGIGRNIKGFIDLITIIFLTGYIKRPGHFFGSIGIFFFILGMLIETYIAGLRIFTGSIQYHYPLMMMGILLMVIGVQLFSTGLLAELIIYTTQKNAKKNLE